MPFIVAFTPAWTSAKTFCVDSRAPFDPVSTTPNAFWAPSARPWKAFGASICTLSKACCVPSDTVLTTCGVPARSLAKPAVTWCRGLGDRVLEEAFALSWRRAA